EFADAGSLSDEVEKKGPLPVELARRYFEEIVQGIYFMHSNQIAHNDFKLDNVLLMWDEKRQAKYCKVTDFGLSPLADKHGVGLIYSSRYCGTRHYMAPEVIRCGMDERAASHYVPFSADIWSIGVGLYVMLYREFPYEIPRNYSKLLKQMEEGVVDPRNI